MDLKTINDYRTMARFEQFKNSGQISLDIFMELLEKADKLHQENQFLYEKLNIITDVIQETREEVVNNHQKF